MRQFLIWSKYQKLPVELKVSALKLPPLKCNFEKAMSHPCLESWEECNSLQFRLHLDHLMIWRRLQVLSWKECWNAIEAAKAMATLGQVFQALIYIKIVPLPCSQFQNNLKTKQSEIDSITLFSTFPPVDGSMYLLNFWRKFQVWCISGTMSSWKKKEKRSSSRRPAGVHQCSRL